MQNESYVPDPSQPEGPNIDASQANALGSSMVQGAADSIRQASELKEQEHAEQLEKTLQEGTITEVPSDIKTTTVRPTTTTTTTATTPPTTTVRPQTTTTKPTTETKIYNSSQEWN